MKAEEPSRSARRQWTPDEEDALRSMVETHAIDQTASVLGHSVVAVRVRASRLGLVWMIGAGWRSAGEVADIFGVDVAWITARIDRGELQATNSPGRLPVRPMAERYRISELALRAFLMGHAHELDARVVDLSQLIEIMAGRNWESGGEAAPGLDTHPRWTEDERSRLRSLVRYRTCHQTALVLRRSVASVRLQASRLGLKWRIQAKFGNLAGSCPWIAGVKGVALTRGLCDGSGKRRRPG